MSVPAPFGVGLTIPSHDFLNHLTLANPKRGFDQNNQMA